MERRRIPYERERWLSAVLIVAAIAGVSLAVPLWPLPVPPAARAVERLLPARALPLIDLPGALAASTASPSIGRVAPHAVTLALFTGTSGTVAAAVPVEAGSPTPVPTTTTASDAVADDRIDVPLLTGRRIDLATTFPSSDDDTVLTSSSSSSLAFVEYPAVAVTRVVVVAGRGIRTGLRATGAVFRAAF